VEEGRCLERGSKWDRNMEGDAIKKNQLKEPSSEASMGRDKKDHETK